MDLEKLNLVPLNRVIDKLKNVLIPIKKKGWSKIDVSIAKILADDVFAKLDNPPFNNSAIDGYALKLEKIKGKQTFRVLKKASTPGSPFKGILKKNEAVKILTGAQVPEALNARFGGTLGAECPSAVRRPDDDAHHTLRICVGDSYL